MNFKVERIKDCLFKYKPPVQIGYFSTDSNNEFKDDDSRMKYLSMPENLEDLHLDLNEGFSEYISVFNDEEEPYNKLLRWIISHKKEVKSMVTEVDSSKLPVEDKDTLTSSSKRVHPEDTISPSKKKLRGKVSPSTGKKLLGASNSSPLEETGLPVEEKDTLTSSSKRVYPEDTISPSKKKLRGKVSPSTGKKLLAASNSSSPKETGWKIDFICHRSALKAINLTPYDIMEGWQIHATKFRSVIYLHKIENENKLEQEKTLTEKEKRSFYWGHKFEQCITSDCINSKPNTSQPVNVNEKFLVVMKGKLNCHGILFSGETDAVDPKRLTRQGNDSKSMDRFVEMKTCQEQDRRGRKFKWKLLKWYLQSFIAGVPRLICGFRSVDGIVQEIKEYEVSELPRMAEPLWDSNVCLNLGSSFLNHVKQCVVEDDPKVVYKFYWKPSSNRNKPVITCEKLSSEYQFLPDWYIKEMEKL